MNLANAVRSGFKNTLNFSGRAARSEYWYFGLFVTIVWLLTGFIDQIAFNVPLSESIGHKGTWGPITKIYVFIIILPSAALSIRRLHDIERSGWWLLVTLVPIIGDFLWIVFCCRTGTEGSNQYGPDPLYPDIK